MLIQEESELKMTPTHLTSPINTNGTYVQIRNYYDLEKAIADKIKTANREGRKKIYQTMYKELFKRVPDHPRPKALEDVQMIKLANQSKVKLIEKFLNKSTVFMEFSAGECTFAI